MTKTPAATKSRSLKTRLAKIITGMVLAVMVPQVGFNYWVMINHGVILQEELLEAKASAIASLTDNELQSIGETVRHLADNDLFEFYARSRDTTAMRQYLKQYTDIFQTIRYQRADQTLDIVSHLAPKAAQDAPPEYSLINQAEAEPNQVHYLVHFMGPDREIPIMELAYLRTSAMGEPLGLLHFTATLGNLGELLKSTTIGDSGFFVLVDGNSYQELLFSGSQYGEIAQSFYRELDRIDSRGGIPILGWRKVGDCVCFVVTANIPRLNWWVVAAMPRAEFLYPLRQMDRANLLALAIIVIATILIVGYAGRRIIEPIRLITETTRKISDSGELERRVEWQSGDELGRLARTFNRMLDKLADSTHELIRQRTFRHQIVHSIGDALFVINRDGVIVEANPAAAELLQTVERKLQGLNLFELSPDGFKSARQKVNDRLQDHSVVGNVELELKRPDGQSLPVAITVSELGGDGDFAEGYVIVAKDISERKQVEARLHYLANHDSLTGLPNRTLMLDRLQQALSRMGWRDKLVAVLFLDLDRFKVVNDSLGHQIGDELLTSVARRLEHLVREGDTVARQGGDEFVVILDDIGHRNDINLVAEKIRQSLSKPFLLAGQEFVTNVSIGISVAPDHGSDANELLKKADTAMYQVKSRGRNSYLYYATDMDRDSVSTLSMESELRLALEQGQFEMHYQPQVTVSNGGLVGFESLIRWRHPARGLVSPGEFLPVAEDSGLIVPIGDWVLTESCRQAKAWVDAGLLDGCITVNVADRQFRMSSFPEQVAEVLRATGLPPRHLDLELTEGILMTDVVQSERTIAALREIGVQLSLDDFGTGYSSLAHLKRFEFDHLKVDRSFVQGLPTDPEDVALTRTIVTMAHSLGLKVIAEGVEREEQLAFLKQLGCDAVQGFLFSPALPASAAASWFDHPTEPRRVSS